MGSGAGPGAEAVGLLGAVLAGGGSRRFGSPKALARVGQVTMVERAVRSLAGAGLPVAVVTGDERVRRAARSMVGAFLTDRVPDAGPLAGLHAALVRAQAEGRPGVFLLGCDLPLVPSPLVTLVASRFNDVRPTVPESPGPAGLEPLVACYPTGCLPEVEEHLQGRDGVRGMVDLVRALDARVVPLEDVRAIADPETAFLNVNTREDLVRAERSLARGASAGG